jgi:hypothetical protein
MLQKEDWKFRRVTVLGSVVSVKGVPQEFRASYQDTKKFMPILFGMRTASHCSNVGICFDGTLNLTMASSYNSAFVAMFSGGLPQAEAALISGLENGQTYFNIHTPMNPGGEIRGELAPVPLPAALSLFATGLGALGLLGWRRKKAAALNA